MDGRILLDTSAAIRYLEDDPAVVRVVARTATAQCHGLTLVTSDAHFRHVPDLPALYLETPRRI